MIEKRVGVLADPLSISIEVLDSLFPRQLKA